MSQITLHLSDPVKVTMQRERISERQIVHTLTQPTKTWQIMLQPIYQPAMLPGTHRYRGKVGTNILLVSAFQAARTVYEVYHLDVFWEELYSGYLNAATAIYKPFMTAGEFDQVVEESDYISGNFHYKTVGDRCLVVEIHSQQGGPVLKSARIFGEETTRPTRQLDDDTKPFHPKARRARVEESHNLLQAFMKRFGKD